MTIALAKIGTYLLMIVWAMIPWRRWGARLGLPCHDYRYRNPYTRTCTKCRRQEDYHCWAWNLYRREDHGWWETMTPGHKGHNCSGKDANEPRRQDIEAGRDHLSA